MNPMRRILAATDFSGLGNHAVRRAMLLAAREDAELLVVHAFPRPATCWWSDPKRRDRRHFH